MRYLILRPWVRDLVPELPSEKTANRYSVADFTSRSLRLVLEAKFVRDKQHGKSLSKELRDDIEVYRHHPYCDTIVFFVYDPDSHIPDHRELRRTIEQSRVYGSSINLHANRETVVQVIGRMRNGVIRHPVTR